MEGFYPTDFEDISLAAVREEGGNEKHYLMVGDFGNNLRNRRNFSIYIFPEPEPRELQK